MIPQDILGNARAHGSSVLPGRWHLDFHPRSTLEVRIFRAQAAGTAHAPDAEDTKETQILGRTRTEVVETAKLDPLEKAWRDINGAGAGGQNVLNTACAVVVPGPERELWVFGKTLGDVEGCDEVLPRPPALSVEAHIKCEAHGGDWGCLAFPNSGAGDSDVASNASIMSACLATFAPTQAWQHLEAAVGEKFAWHRGQRIALLASASLTPPYKVTLRPTADGALGALLHFRAVPQPSVCALTPAPRHLRPTLLKPFMLPALPVAPIPTSLEQCARLGAAFDAAFGSGWKARRIESRMAALARGEAGAEWSIYYVVQPEPADRQAIISAEGWHERDGVLTVWPSHLALDLSAAAQVRVRPARPLPPLPPTQDLIGTATSIFDFFAAYVEPAPAAELEADADADGVDDEVDEPAESVDDLFSAPSDSPTAGIDDLFDMPTPKAEVGPVAEPVPDGDAPSAPSPSRTERPPSPTYVQPSDGYRSRPDTEYVDNDYAGVTEDDFAFFDSPTEGMQVDAVASPVPDVAVVQEQATGVPETQVPMPLDTRTVVEPPIVAVSPEIIPEQATELVLADSTLPSSSPAPISPPRPVADMIATSEACGALIPPEYEPLALSTETVFTYALPSPAPTTPSLRLDLVKRLRTSKGYDYGSAWDVESAASDADDDDDDGLSGAPPTPQSITDEPERKRARTTPVAREDVGIEFGGVRCIDAEWAVIKDDTSTAAALACKWNAAWSDGAQTGAPTSPADPLAFGDTVYPVYKALLGNRLLRDHFVLPPDSPSPIQELDAGSTLADFAHAPALLPQPAVNVGFGGSVMRVSVAALGYWRELGLQPAGGQKNVAAFVLCDATLAAASGAVLSRTAEAYEASHLGRHENGEAIDSKDGVIVAATSDARDRIAALCEAAIVPTIVYVVFHDADLPTVASWLALSDSKTIVHPIPASSLPRLDPTALAPDVYARLPRKVDRMHVHGAELPGDAVYMQHHAFTLSSADVTPTFSLTWPPKTYDVLVRRRGVFGAYAWIRDRAALVVAAIDEQGDACELQVFSVAETDTATCVVDRAFAWLSAFADAASTDWRMTVCALGVLALPEIEAWRALASKHRDTLFAIMVDAPPAAPARPRSLDADVAAAILTDPSACVVDETLAAHFAELSARLPVGDDPSVYVDAAFMLTTAAPSAASYATATYYVLTEGEHVLQDIAKQLYGLACLGRKRYGFDGGLPAHLEAVRAVVRAAGARDM
ncbi:hypothetical protein Q5752_000228 [Cryptotrichosporon argae]